jgi:hypothetical protein
MLFQAVSKYTRVHHPDYPWVNKCFKRFEVAQKQADRQADRDNLQLTHIQKHLDPPRPLPTSAKLVDQFTLQAQRRKWRFIFWSTEIWILQLSAERLVYREGHEYLDFTICEYGARTIVCWEISHGPKCIHMYDLQNEGFRDELTARYRLQYRLQSDASRTPLPVRWSVLSSSSVRNLGVVHARAYHSMVAVPSGDGEAVELIMFGGKTRSDELTDTTYRLHETDGAWTFAPIETPPGRGPAPRYHAAMVATPDGVFMYGGTTNGVDGFADLWWLSPDGWDEVSTEGDQPPAGFALNLAYFAPETLLLTGGCGAEFVFYRFAIRLKRWTKVTTDASFVLPPYVGHQVFPVGDGIGLIVNGHTLTLDERCNDSVIQFAEWGATPLIFIECSGMAPIGRVWGSSGMIGNYILVIGGERESELYALDLRDQVWHFSKAVSTEQPVLFGAASAIFKNKIYLHGGCDDTTSVQSTLHEGMLEGIVDVAGFELAFTDDFWKKETIAKLQFDKPEPWFEVPGTG